MDERLPHPIPGIEWRYATTDDVAGLAAYMRRVHEAERLSFLPGDEFFAWLLEQPGIDVGSDAIVAASDGAIVADAGTWLHLGEHLARCIIWGEAAPGFEHLKPALFTWAVDRARARLADVDPAIERVIRTSVEDHRTEHRAVIEAAGLTEARVFAEMARPLTDLPAAPPLPAGVTVVPWADEWAESARIASNESFADHWGSIAMTPEEFAGFVTGNPNFRPDLSFLAIDGDEVVSICFCEVDDEDNADRDTDDLYLHRIGTKRSHRGLRLASHLIVRSLEAAAATGRLNRAALEVDEMSHTNATAVYERLGFETYARSVNLFTTL